MPEPLEELKKVKEEKRDLLKKDGVDPYPPGWGKLESRQLVAACQKQALQSQVIIAGRIMGWRDHGKIIFADLKDKSGSIQISFKKDDLGKETYGHLTHLDIGDFIGVEGSLYQTKTGELTVAVNQYKLLSKSIRPLPSEWYGLEDKETRYRQRYLDLILNPEVKELFLTRTRVVSELRRLLDDNEFVEVETPVLQPIYGGASAQPFTTHHNALDIDLYLRISDELYLKRLIVGGFEKVYEISKDFRNEGIDRQHNPEFTMLEFYWAYADYHQLMEFTENILAEVMINTVGSTVVEYQGNELDFTPPLPRINYTQVVKENTAIDLDETKGEAELLKVIREANIQLDLDGIAGYGALVDKLFKETCRPQMIQPTFLVDHPAETVALAKRKPDEPSKVARFQLLVAGFEVINAYNELNDPVDQKQRWLEMEKLGEEGLEEHEVLDEDYIRALEYGMPPTAGFGMGIDRFVALITDSPTLKETILFPTMRPEK